MRTHYLTFFILIQLVGLSLAGAQEPIVPLIVSKKDSSASITEKALLGKLLFSDPRFSKDQQVSCTSCHQLNKFGVDGQKFSAGVQQRKGIVNAPTVFNSHLNFSQFWDGRAKNLEDQIDGPIAHPNEMGSSWDQIMAVVQQNSSYSKKFNKIYGSVSPQNFKNAIAEFEKNLVSGNSRFDRYLVGEKEILSTVEKRGYEKFKNFGCIACHQGQNIGGNMFQTMGVMGDYFGDRGGQIQKADLGRYNVTKKESDKFMFKVPSLRNVAVTAPYFHDGSALTLDQAVKMMGRYQLGMILSAQDIQEIVSFLKTLTGERPAILSASEASP